MNVLLSLWLPILLSAGVVFFISCLVHMVIKWHASDCAGFSNEDAVREAIRAGNPVPGKKYLLPFCADMKEMGSDTMQKKYREGPVGQLAFSPNGPPAIGRYLVQWFLWSVVVATIAALFASRLVPHDHAHAMKAAKVAGAVTLIAHGFGTVQESIWAERAWLSSAKYLFDSTLYAVGTGFVFLWLWH